MSTDSTDDTQIIKPETDKGGQKSQDDTDQTIVAKVSTDSTDDTQIIKPETDKGGQKSQDDTDQTIVAKVSTDSTDDTQIIKNLKRTKVAKNHRMILIKLSLPRCQQILLMIPNYKT